MTWRVESDLGPHLERLHYFAVEMGARQVIELGVRAGTSTRALLAAMDKTGGRLWSCDVCDSGELDEIRDNQRWTFHIGDDLEAADDAPRVCDLLFIDTSHERVHTTGELALYGPRVREGGLIVLHDADPLPGQDVIGPALEYARNNGLMLTYYPHSYGLAVIG